MIDRYTTTNDEGYMKPPTSSVELLSTLDHGVHVEYETRDGERRSGMVLSGPMPHRSNKVVVRVRSDQDRETIQIPWQSITLVESQ